MPILDPVELPESEGGGVTYGVPANLYHYTGQSGLLGILDDGALRCSDAHFLNDAREVRYAVDLAARRVEEFAEDFEPRDPAYNDEGVLFDSLVRGARGLLDVPLFVFSLSVDPNVLSQWRAYCPDEGGYAIGFSSRDLGHLADNQGFKLTRCIYEEEHQHLLLDELIRDTVEAYQGDRDEGAPVSSDLYRRHTTNFMSEFFQYAAAFKDRAFEEEQEWRLVAEPRTAHDEEVCFREGPSTPVPYLNFRLQGSDGEPLPISRIWVGPTRNRDLDLRVVQQLVDTYTRPTADVRASDIPYRTW